MRSISLYSTIVIIMSHLSFLHLQSSATPLLKAAKHGYSEIAVILLENGSNINERDEVRMVTLGFSS